MNLICQKKEEYLTQPTLVLLRQFLDAIGWLNGKDLSFMKHECLISLTAEGIPGGVHIPITKR